MAFATIEPAEGLSPSERRRAARLGPVAVLVRTSYRQLLVSAGFVDVERHDETAEYAKTQWAWIVASDRHEIELRSAVGDEEFDRRRRERLDALDAIRAGLLVRSTYHATRP